MGLWMDDKGSVYVAVARERLVLKAQVNGASVIVARSLRLVAFGGSVRP
jgi:hypothetical protein